MDTLIQSFIHYNSQLSPIFSHRHTSHHTITGPFTLLSSLINRAVSVPPSVMPTFLRDRLGPRAQNVLFARAARKGGVH